VPVDEAPPTTVVGVSVMEVSEGGLMARVAVKETVPTLAVIVALVTVETPVVETINVAVV
jgi:hypothetical protein